MGATKEQERKALVRIKKIVDELGENSYVGTAFEGCFQDAENNIEDDAAYSMKSRFECSEEKLVTAQEEIVDLKRKVSLHQETIGKHQEEKERLEARLISEIDLRHCLELENKDLAGCEQRKDDAAEKIVAYADNPTSEEFKQAVADHRNLTESIKAKKMRIARMNDILEAGK